MMAASSSSGILGDLLPQHRQGEEEPDPQQVVQQRSPQWQQQHQVNAGVPPDDAVLPPHLLRRNASGDGVPYHRQQVLPSPSSSSSLLLHGRPDLRRHASEGAAVAIQRGLQVQHHQQQQLFLAQHQHHALLLQERNEALLRQQRELELRQARIRLQKQQLEQQHRDSGRTGLLQSESPTASQLAFFGQDPQQQRFHSLPPPQQQQQLMYQQQQRHQPLGSGTPQGPDVGIPLHHPALAAAGGGLAQSRAAVARASTTNETPVCLSRTYGSSGDNGGDSSIAGPDSTVNFRGGTSGWRSGGATFHDFDGEDLEPIGFEPSKDDGPASPSSKRLAPPARQDTYSSGPSKRTSSPSSSMTESMNNSVSDNGDATAGAGMPSSSLLHNSCKLYPDTPAVVESALRMDPGAIRRYIPTRCGDDVSAGNRSISVDSIGSSGIAATSGDGNSQTRRSDDMYGYPINIALKCNASREVLEFLMAEGADVLDKPDGSMRASTLGIAISLGCDGQIIRRIVTTNRACARVADRQHQLPLHALARSHHKPSVLEAVKQVYEAYPEALNERNFHRETPLDIAVRNEYCPEEVVNFLQEQAFGDMEEDAINQLDDLE